MTFIGAEGVIIRTACCTGNRETIADLHAFYCADRHHGPGKVRIQLVEYGLADSGGHTVDHTFDHTAGGVLFMDTVVQIISGSFGVAVIRHVQRVGEDASVVVIGFRYFNIADRLGVGGDTDPKLLQEPGCHGSGGNASDGLPPGRPAASPVVPESVLGVKGVVGMPRTVTFPDPAVIPGALVLIADQQGDGRSGSLPFKDAGEYLYLIGFISCGSIFVLTGFPAV